MISLVLSLIVIGLVSGALARLAVPGRQHLSLTATTVIGILGSFLGAFLGYLLHHGRGEGAFRMHTAGLVGSLVGAIIVLLAYSAINKDVNRRPLSRR